MKPRGRAVRRIVLTAGALASVGFLSCVLGVTAGVLAGGVPYHDGPNAGFASPPGFRRVLEHAAGPLLVVGALLLLAAGVALVLAAGVALVLAAGVALVLAWVRRRGEARSSVRGSQRPW